MGHNSLHSCFEGTHGAQCSTCLKELYYSYQQHQKGKTATQIRAAIIRGEWKQIDLQAAATSTSAIAVNAVVLPGCERSGSLAVAWSQDPGLSTHRTALGLTLPSTRRLSAYFIVSSRSSILRSILLRKVQEEFCTWLRRPTAKKAARGRPSLYAGCAELRGRLARHAGAQVRQGEAPFPEGDRRSQQRAGGSRLGPSQHLQPSTGALDRQSIQDARKSTTTTRSR